MPEYQFDLAEPVAESHVAELVRRVYFVSESIVDFQLVTSGSSVISVVVVTDEPVDPDALGAKLRFMVTNDVSSQLMTPPKVLWQSPATRPPRSDAFAAMLADQVLYEIGPGQVALGQPAIAALDALDALLVDIVKAEFDATEYRYPTLLPLRALHRSGYLTSFPQHLMFAARLHGDLDTYHAFAAVAAERKDLAQEVLPRCSPVDRCLPPTMCYHTFDQLAGRRLDAAILVVTARGGSFRHEARYHRTLERLSDFTIRETVFLGPADFVRDARDRFRKRASELVEQLGLAGRCEVANDPFFASADGAARISSQRLLELKHELHLDIEPDGRSVAVGSFNLHDRHFGAAFDIRDPAGEIVHSGCVGFGLERLTYALLCQYGWEVSEWPQPLRQRCTPAVLSS